MFSYQRKVHFYETDLMGIVHHSNYIRFCEEARVAWAMSVGLIDNHNPKSASELAVLSVDINYLKPLKFPNEFDIKLQVKLEGAKLVFEYKIFSKNDEGLLHAQACTKHVAIDENLKSKRPSGKVKNILRNELWIETWLLNL
jgi:acyl-CoA thioester hydrolase